MNKKATTAALVIDLQGVGENMDADDAQGYLNAMGQTLSHLRKQNIPVVWVVMHKNTGVHKPDKGAASSTRDVADLKSFGFDIDASDKKLDTSDRRRIFCDFIAQYGPRKNETICCKTFESALLEKSDASDNSDYKTLLNEEINMPPEEFSDFFEKHFGKRQSLTQHLKNDLGADNVLLMGTMSSHCIAQTAISAWAKKLNPTVLVDRILSWRGDERAVDPKTTLSLWRGINSACKSAAGWDAYHQRKVTNKIAEEQAKPARRLAQADLNIGFSTADIAIYAASGQRAPSAGLQNKM